MKREAKPLEASPSMRQWLHEKYVRSQEVLRWEGVRSFLLRTIKKIVRPVIEIQRFFFFETDLTTPLPLLQARIPLTLRPLRIEEVETFTTAFQAEGLDWQEVHRRLARGEVCILALSGSQVVHFQWIAFSSVWIEEIGITLHLNPGEAYSYQAVTPPAWRGLGIGPAVGSFLNQHERAQGCTRHISYVRADNKASLRMMTRLPRKRTKTVWSIRILGRRRSFLFGAMRAGSPSFALPSCTEQS